MRLLDLFCGAGGASMGYHLAGFEIVGVDIAPQPNYPFPFVQGNALEWEDWDFDLIHASPPCQPFTRYRNNVKDIETRYDDNVVDTLTMLDAQPVPWVLENVPSAPIHPDLILCGSMFGLDVRRHRWFQLGGWSAMSPGGCNHKGWSRRYKASTNRPNQRFTIEVGAWDEDLETQKQAMGVDWEVTLRELSEAIPPAYTHYIGNAFVNASSVPSRLPS